MKCSGSLLVRVSQTFHHCGPESPCILMRCPHASLWATTAQTDPETQKAASKMSNVCVNMLKYTSTIKHEPADSKHDIVVRNDSNILTRPQALTQKTSIQSMRPTCNHGGDACYTLLHAACINRLSCTTMEYNLPKYKFVSASGIGCDKFRSPVAA